MGAAERHGPFVADLAAQRPRLGESEVMRLAWQPRADEAGERGDVPTMSLVTDPLRKGERQLRFVDRVRPVGFAWRRPKASQPLLVEALEDFGVVDSGGGDEVGAHLPQLVDPAGIAHPEDVEILGRGCGFDGRPQPGTEALGRVIAAGEVSGRGVMTDQASCAPGGFGLRRTPFCALS
jgi:hypothetical protein